MIYDGQKANCAIYLTWALSFGVPSLLCLFWGVSLFRDSTLSSFGGAGRLDQVTVATNTSWPSLIMLIHASSRMCRNVWSLQIESRTFREEELYILMQTALRVPFL